MLSRADEAMQRSKMFDVLYAAVCHLDDLINIHGFAKSFRIWDGKRHVVYALDEEIQNVNPDLS